MGSYTVIVRYSIIACCLVTSFVACDSQSENCLDSRAINLDVSADLACDDCCVYPGAQLRLLPLRSNGDSLVFAQAGSASVIGIDTFRVESFGFYLHDLTLITNNGSRVLLSDTLSTREDDSVPFTSSEHSVMRITPFTNTSYNIGELLERDTFVSLSAKLGLPDDLKSIDPSSQYSLSPLAIFDSLLISDNGGYLDSRVVYTDNNGERFNLSIPSGLEEELVLTFPISLEYEASYNLRIEVDLIVDPFSQLDNTTLRNSFIQTINTNFEIRETSLTR